jgi:tetratricopeptide (TPR) repeat protein
MDTDPVRLGEKALEAGDLVAAKTYFQEAVANNHKVPRAMFGLAEITIREGQYPDAEAYYRKAIAASGGPFPQANAGLGLLLLRLGRDQEAAQEFDTALAADSDLWTAHYGKARLLMAEQKWSQAKKELDRGQKLRGLAEGEEKYRYGMALYQLETGDVASAEKSALLAMHLNPTDPEYGTLVGRIYEMDDNTTLAINAYEQALATPGMTPTAPMLTNLGQLYRQEKRYNEARDRLTQAVVVDSTYTPALKDLGELYRLAKQHDKAARVYLRYIQLEREDRQALLDLADSCYEIRRYGQAVAAGRTARQMAPDDQMARFQFARAGIYSSDDDVKAEAAPLMTDLPRDLPWQANDFVALAAWQTSRKKYPAALQSLEQAVALDPEQPHIPFQRGVVHLRLSQPDLAVSDFREAVQLNPESAANHLNLGIASYQAGQLPDARAAFQQAVAVDPDQTMARLLLAQVLAATNALPAAEKEYREVLNREPDNAKAMRGLGFCRIRQADYAAAIAAYRDATGAEPGNADGWAGLGSAYLGSQNLAEAEAAFAKARAIDPKNIMLVKGTELLNQAKAAGKEN